MKILKSDSATLTTTLFAPTIRILRPNALPLTKSPAPDQKPLVQLRLYEDLLSSTSDAVNFNEDLEIWQRYINDYIVCPNDRNFKAQCPAPD